ncbi:MAG TPA: ester cyclase [Candidatus Dormibacteraeota bacterium]|nr:ester cyclase [Candidatus Dormibacteraeota bacterium]
MADPKQVARQSIDMFNYGKIDEWGKTVREDAEIVSPMAGTVKGRDAMIGYFKQMRQTFPDARIDIHKVIAEGNTIVVEYTFTGTNKGPMQLPTGDTIPATNKTLSGPALDIAEVDDQGRLKSLRQYFDVARGLQQLGLAPQPAAAART